MHQKLTGIACRERPGSGAILAVRLDGAGQEPVRQDIILLQAVEVIHRCGEAMVCFQSAADFGVRPCYIRFSLPPEDASTPDGEMNSPPVRASLMARSRSDATLGFRT